MNDENLIQETSLLCAKELESTELMIGRVLDEKETLCFKTGFLRGLSVGIKNSVKEMREFIRDNISLENRNSKCQEK